MLHRFGWGVGFLNLLSLDFGRGHRWFGRLLARRGTLRSHRGRSGCLFDRSLGDGLGCLFRLSAGFLFCGRFRNASPATQAVFTLRQHVCILLLLAVLLFESGYLGRYSLRLLMSPVLARWFQRPCPSEILSHGHEHT